MAKPIGPVHILRQWVEVDVDGTRALSHRHDVEPGTWCGLPVPKSGYAFEGSARAKSNSACAACREALKRDLEARPAVVAARERNERLSAGLVACEDGEHLEDKLTRDVVWCSRCGSVSIDGGEWRVPEHLFGFEDEPPRVA